MEKTDPSKKYLNHTNYVVFTMEVLMNKEREGLQI